MPNVKLSEVLSHLMGQASFARAMHDVESVRLAQQYAEDKWLKFFQASRFPFHELEIDLPLVVSELIPLNQGELIFEKQNFKAELEKTVLGGLIVDPTTKSVLEVKNPNNLLRIRMKMNEQAISVQTIEDSNGQKREIIELD